MNEYTSIFIVATVFLLALVIYTGYMHKRIMDLEKKISRLKES